MTAKKSGRVKSGRSAVQGAARQTGRSSHGKTTSSARKQAENSPQLAAADVERLVEERTAELARENEQLRRKIEEQKRASLNEKEVLLREIQHRVKNNMQVVTGLLRMQARRITSQPALEAFAEAENRVKAMALIHEALYHSGSLSTSSLQRYVERLCDGLEIAFGRSKPSISLTIDVDGVTIGNDDDVSIGLLLNELLSNCFKHAFPGGGVGNVAIAVRPAAEGEVELVVADDGVGLPQDIDLHNTETVGLGLVVGLAEYQLGGSVEIDRNGGTEFTITFKPRLN